MLGAAAEPRILGAQRLVSLEEREDGESERVLHARAPKSIELTLEDPQGVGGSLISVPAEANVEQIDAKWPPAVGDVEVHDIR